jgi:hypothetical protein
METMMGGAGIKPRKDTPRGKANPAAQPVATMHARMVSGPAAKDVRGAAKCAAIIVAPRPTACPASLRDLPDSNCPTRSRQRASRSPSLCQWLDSQPP